MPATTSRSEMTPTDSYEDGLPKGCPRAADAGPVPGSLEAVWLRADLAWEVARRMESEAERCAQEGQRVAASLQTERSRRRVAWVEPRRARAVREVQRPQTGKVCGRRTD